MTDTFAFIHGWATDASVWDNVAGEVSGSAACLKIDLPGHGAAHGWDEPTIAPAVREMTSAIKDARPGTVVGVGWSLGAICLLDLPPEELEKFRAFVLVGATPCFTAKKDFPWGQSRALVKRMILDMKAEPATATERFYPLNFTAAELEGKAAGAFLEKYRYPGPVQCTEGGPDSPPGCFPAFSYDDITRALESLYVTDLRERLGSIHIPTLVVHGSEDAVCPVGAGEFLADKMKNARLRILDGAGHAPFLTRPQEFTDAVSGFITGL